MRSGVCDPREWRGGRDQSDKGEERLVDFAAVLLSSQYHKERGAGQRDAVVEGPRGTYHCCWHHSQMCTRHMPT